MLRIGVLVSGGGTNLQVIMDNIKNGALKDCEIAVVVSSRKGAYALQRAADAGIDTVCIAKKDYGDIDSFSDAILEIMIQKQVGLVVLGGFLSMLGSRFVEYYKDRIMNVHPALIPSFCGKGFYGLTPHVKAIEYGVKVTGATVHFIDYEYDSGPIILQKAIYINEDDTPESLQKRVMEQAEQVVLPEAIKLFSEGRLRVEGRKVRILDIR